MRNIWNTTANVSICLLLTVNAYSAPSPVTDTYSLAMGQSEAALISNFGIMRNPAALTLGASPKDIYIAGGFGQMVRQGHTVSDDQRELQRRLGTLSTDSANATPKLYAVTESLRNNIDRDLRFAGGAMGLPNLPLGIAGFVSAYYGSQLRASATGSPDYSNPAAPDPATTIAFKGVALLQAGGQFSRIIRMDSGEANKLSVGITPKLQSVRTYYYAQPASTLNIDTQTKQTNSSSLFNLDIGIIQESDYTMKTGLYIKNLFRQDTQYGTTDERYSIEPEVKIGFSKRAARYLLAGDFDLGVTAPSGFEQHHRNLGLGADIYVVEHFRLRGGLNRNLIGDSETIFSFGAGVEFGFGEIQAAYLRLNNDASVSVSTQFQM